MARRGVQRLCSGVVSVGAAIALVTASCAPIAGAQAVSDGPPTAASMQAALHSSRGCLSVLTPADRQLLVLRFGIGGKPHKSDEAVAAALGLPVATVVARETQAVGAVARACGVAPPAPTALRSAGPSAAGAPVAAARGASGGGVSAGEALAVAAIAACLIIAAHEFRKAFTTPRPRA